ncbi:hypothetical protein [Lacipirellula limnantheis]|uniref:Uncharacterized protein n=1 Tax=Lacipirellula limnantheis TaxID=2528024 RepID=A0A517TVX4_9BACT|nr:hypothetical protein [Lacipirellula limnantheis]QDT72517.1 hypothetical protein I41_16970 [Lacipirellula limnantheis]
MFLRRLVETEPGGLGTREFIGVLRLLEGCSWQRLQDAVEHALDIGVHDADAIRLIVEHRRQAPVALCSLDGRPKLRLVDADRNELSARR